MTDSANLQNDVPLENFNSSGQGFVRIQHSHETAKLIGSLPGYLGHGETHPLIMQEGVGRKPSRSPETKFSVRRD